MPPPSVLISKGPNPYRRWSALAVVAAVPGAERSCSATFLALARQARPPRSGAHWHGLSTGLARACRGTCWPSQNTILLAGDNKHDSAFAAHLELHGPPARTDTFSPESYKHANQICRWMVEGSTSQ